VTYPPWISGRPPTIEHGCAEGTPETTPFSVCDVVFRRQLTPTIGASSTGTESRHTAEGTGGARGERVESMAAIVGCARRVRWCIPPRSTGGRISARNRMTIGFDGCVWLSRAPHQIPQVVVERHAGRPVPGPTVSSLPDRAPQSAGAWLQQSLVQWHSPGQQQENPAGARPTPPAGPGTATS